MTSSSSDGCSVITLQFVLELDIDHYGGWTEVIVYPDEFVPRREYVDDAGVVSILQVLRMAAGPRTGRPALSLRSSAGQSSRPAPASSWPRASLPRRCSKSFRAA